MAIMARLVEMRKLHPGLLDEVVELRGRVIRVWEGEFNSQEHLVQPAISTDWFGRYGI